MNSDSEQIGDLMFNIRVKIPSKEEYSIQDQYLIKELLNKN